MSYVYNIGEEMEDKECCGSGWAVCKGIFLIGIAALIWLNDSYAWLNTAQLIAVILGIMGLKILIIHRK